MQLIGEPDRIDQLLCPVVPAAPGCMLLMHCFNRDGSVSIVRTPVVAWRVGRFFVNPITPGGESRCTEDGQPTVLLPDGQVLQQGDTTLWPDEAAWRTEMDEKAKDPSEQHAAKTSRPVLSSVKK